MTASSHYSHARCRMAAHGRNPHAPPSHSGGIRYVRSRRTRYSGRKVRRSGTRLDADIDEVVTVLMPAEPGNTSLPGYYVKYRYRDASGVQHRDTNDVLL